MKEILKKRTKRLAIDIIRFSDLLPNKNSGWIIQKQIIRSSSSVAANYRALCFSKSKKDFIYKLSILIEEADETLFWLELINEVFIADVEKESRIKSATLNRLKTETNELISIFIASIKTAKHNN